MRTLAVIGAVIIALVVAGSVLALPRSIIVKVDQTPMAWSDSRLTEKLVTTLSRDQELRVVEANRAAMPLPAFPSDRTNFDSLLEWGVEIGGRYLLTVRVDREGLECRKTFSVPLIFHRWETLAVIAGEIRLLDVQKGRLLLAESFEERVRAARQFQSSSEDDKHDAALHVSAADKSALFGTLEDKLVECIMKKIARHTRGY